MAEIIVLDTTFDSLKHQAVREVFPKHLLNIEIFEKNKKIDTPVRFGQFIPKIQERIELNRKYLKAKETKQKALIISIQNGFIKSKKRGGWYLTSIVGIEYEGILYTSFAQSIKMKSATNATMNLSEQGRYDLLLKLHPNFKEIDWLKKPLNECKAKIKLA